MRRRHIVLALPATLAWPHVRAQGPGPVKVLIGFAPGGSVDALARLAAEAIQQGTGRNAIVESRTGAAGRIAVEAVKTATPDGDTLLVAPQGPMTLFPHVFRGLKFDPAKDFVPVTRLATGDFALTIGPAWPITSVCPSGVARTATSVGMVPPAPARLSTTTGCPQRSVSFCPITRDR